jgi:hypothetical protein
MCHPLASNCTTKSKSDFPLALTIIKHLDVGCVCHYTSTTKTFVGIEASKKTRGGYGTYTFSNRTRIGPLGKRSLLPKIHCLGLKQIL